MGINVLFTILLEFFVEGVRLLLVTVTKILFLIFGELLVFLVEADEIGKECLVKRDAEGVK